MAANIDMADQDGLSLAIKLVKSLKEALRHLDAAHKAQDCLVSFLALDCYLFLFKFSMVFFRRI